MKFGVTVVPSVTDWKLFVDLETMGYDCAWAADSQMLYSDAYAVLALAAANTSRIRLGTGVAVAPMRLAPVDRPFDRHASTSSRPAASFLGIGTGHTAMRVMGQDPMKAGAFREYLRVLRALLHGEEVEYELNGERQEIRFLHADRGFIDVEHPVPIYVAADGPLALKTAGAYGDGRVCSHNQTRARLQKSLETMRQGAVGRRPHLPRRLPHRGAQLCLRAAAGREHDLGPGDRRDRPDGRRDAALLVGVLSEGRRHQHGRPALPQPVGRVPRLHREDGDAARPSATSRSISAIAPSCRRRSAASSPRT